MKLLVSLGRTGAISAAVMMISAPGLAFAETAATPATTNAASAFRVADVSLDAQGALQGQVLTRQGQPLANASALLDNGRQQTVAMTDGEGRFRFENVRAGGYRVQVGNQSQFCRAWKPDAAPPTATRGLMVVQGDQSILGQYCGDSVTCGSPVADSCKSLLTNPLVIGGVIAAAIAIPIAIHNADDDDSAS